MAATLSPIGTIPVAGVMLKFMGECRALTNVCGNPVASIFLEEETVPART